MSKKRGHKKPVVYSRGNNTVYLADFLEDLKKSRKLKREIQHEQEIRQI